MNTIKSLIIASMLVAGSAYADGFGFDLGLFNMHFGASQPEYMSSNRNVLENPICQAISNQEQIEFTVRGVENINAKERKMITKTIIVEPYAFGVTNDGKPVLRGKVVSEKLVREVTVKFGEDKFDDKADASKDKGYFTGKFSSDTKKNIDISRVSDIHIVDNSHFDAPKDYKALKDDNVRVICQLPVVQE